MVLANAGYLEQGLNGETMSLEWLWRNELRAAGLGLSVHRAAGIDTLEGANVPKKCETPSFQKPGALRSGPQAVFRIRTGLTNLFFFFIKKNYG